MPLSPAGAYPPSKTVPPQNEHIYTLILTSILTGKRVYSPRLRYTNLLRIHGTERAPPRLPCDLGSRCQRGTCYSKIKWNTLVATWECEHYSSKVRPHMTAYSARVSFAQITTRNNRKQALSASKVTMRGRLSPTHK